MHASGSTNALIAKPYSSPRPEIVVSFALMGQFLAHRFKSVAKKVAVASDNRHPFQKPPVIPDVH